VATAQGTLVCMKSCAQHIGNNKSKCTPMLGVGQVYNIPLLQWFRISEGTSYKEGIGIEHDFTRHILVSI